MQVLIRNQDFFHLPINQLTISLFTIAPTITSANNNPIYLTPKPRINNRPPTNSNVATLYASPPGKPILVNHPAHCQFLIGILLNRA